MTYRDPPRSYTTGSNSYEITSAKEKKNEISLPKDVNILPDRRVGDDVRNRYVDHLTDMHSRGHLDADEYNARVNFAMKAKTGTELKALVRDLDAPPEPKPAPVDPGVSARKMRERKLWAKQYTGSAALIIGSTSLAIGMPVLVSEHNWWSTIHGAFTVGLSVTVGFILFVMGWVFAISLLVKKVRSETS
jgi:hypothetical protein